ncbi:cysteine-rich receptor-like protein kinase, partial [Trifolium medium]|nr:cysteine-rich receptor-like protein kinase [Trifolium medium]
MVAEMSSLGWEAGGEAWMGRQQLWVWEHDPDRGYSVHGAYQFLTSQQLVTLDEAEELVWHKHVPLK